MSKRGLAKRPDAIARDQGLGAALGLERSEDLCGADREPFAKRQSAEAAEGLASFAEKARRQLAQG